MSKFEDKVEKKWRINPKDSKVEVAADIVMPLAGDQIPPRTWEVWLPRKENAVREI